MKIILRTFIAACIAAITLATTAVAAGSEQDPSGTWTWSMKGRNGTEVQQTLKLEMKNGLLSGSIGGTSRIPEAPITDAHIKGDSIEFNVVRDVRGNRFTTAYQGKIKGNEITGSFKATGSRGGATDSIPWNAIRSM